jgi:hypothetical protein
MLDRVVRDLGISMLDAHDHGASKFMPGAVPTVQITVPLREEGQCLCIPPGSPQPPDPYHAWSYPLPWGDSWTSEQTRNEESRRLSWAALGMVSSYTASRAAESGGNAEPFWICDPSNVRISLRLP